MWRWCKSWWTTKKDKEREQSRGWDDSCIMGIRREASPGAQQVSDCCPADCPAAPPELHWAVANHSWLAAADGELVKWRLHLQRSERKAGRGFGVLPKDTSTLRLQGSKPATSLMILKVFKCYLIDLRILCFTFKNVMSWSQTLRSEVVLVLPVQRILTFFIVGASNLKRCEHQLPVFTWSLLTHFIKGFIMYTSNSCWVYE